MCTQYTQCVYPVSSVYQVWDSYCHTGCVTSVTVAVRWGNTQSNIPPMHFCPMPTAQCVPSVRELLLHWIHTGYEQRMWEGTGCMELGCQIWLSYSPLPLQKEHWEILLEVLPAQEKEGNWTPHPLTDAGVYWGDVACSRDGEQVSVTWHHWRVY